MTLEEVNDQNPHILNILFFDYSYLIQSIIIYRELGMGQGK